MSLLSGLGGSDSGSSYRPTSAPKPPDRTDKNVQKALMADYQHIKRRSSYTKAVLGGGAPPPSKSYSAQLFGPTAGGV